MPHNGQIGITFQSGGHRLLGTLLMARGDEPKATAVLLHGIPGIEKNHDLGLALRDHGWNALIFHYRGCWGSEGRYTLNTIPEDVRAALDALSNGSYPVVNPHKLVLIGHSLGGWAAVLAAASDERVRAVACIAPVTMPGGFPLDDPRVAEDFTPWLPGLAPEELARQWAALEHVLPPVQQVSRISPRPILVIHGELDESVPVKHSRELFKQALEPKRMLLHPAANHSFTWHRAWLCAEVLAWLDDLGLG